jgi:type IV secretory pathway VirB2 component (pilin)
MNTRLSILRAKLNPLAIYVGLMCYLATAAPAYASSATTGSTSGGIDLSNVTNSLNNIIALATGPVAKVIAIICVLGGAAGMMQGREGHEALKNLGIVAFTIGLLIGGVNIMNSAGASI